MIDPYKRFMANVSVDEGTGCWIWQGGKNRDGYGSFTAYGKRYRAHRYSLERKMGRELAAGEICRHMCNVASCVNPDHLEPGSKSDNARDRIEAGRGLGKGITRRQRHGLTPYERFMSYVDSKTTPDGCHLWVGGFFNSGYGRFGVTEDGKRRQYVVTRWLLGYMLDKPLAEDELVLHLCDNRACVRREHLRVGTHAENMADMAERNPNHNGNKTHCIRGHAFTPENTRIGKTNGQRHCLTCNAARNAARYAR